MRLLFAALVALLLLIPTSTWGHGTLSWAAEYHNPNGVPCCTGPTQMGEGDCVEIPEAMAMEATVGKILKVEFPSGIREIVVKQLFASPDPNAPNVVCSPGCLFRGAGM